MRFFYNKKKRSRNSRRRMKRKSSQNKFSFFFFFGFDCQLNSNSVFLSVQQEKTKDQKEKVWHFLLCFRYCCLVKKDRQEGRQRCVDVLRWYYYYYYEKVIITMNTLISWGGLVVEKKSTRNGFFWNGMSWQFIYSVVFRFFFSSKKKMSLFPGFSHERKSDTSSKIIRMIHPATIPEKIPHSFPIWLDLTHRKVWFVLQSRLADFWRRTCTCQSLLVGYLRW